MGGWVALGVAEFGPRLLIAVGGFAIGHAINRLVLGPPPAAGPAATTPPIRSRAIVLGLVALVVVAVVGVALFLVMRRNVDLREAEAHRAKALATVVAAKDAARDDQELRVVVGRHEILVDGVVVTKAEIPALARAAAKKQPGVQAVIVAEAETPYATVIDVMDRVRDGGITDVRLAAPASKSP